MTTGTGPDDAAALPGGAASGEPPGGPASEQRGLAAIVRVGGVLVVVGLLTTVVVLVEYVAGADLPGTWAYLVAMLAPLGFGLILLGLVVVALRRRRAALRDG